MKRVQTFSDFIRIADEWNPVLTKVNTIEEAAININLPHEDFPSFVESTSKTIKEVLIWLKDGSISERDIKQIHQMCMKEKAYLRLGDYRMTDVVVNNELVPPQSYLLPQMMMSICPVGTEFQKDDTAIIEWYKKFETIHPFEDGNGRVGGVILAAVSYLNSGKFIVSKKEYQYIIDPILKRITNKDDIVLNTPKYFDMTLDFNTRVLQYVTAKLKNIKVEFALNETDSYEKLVELIEDKDVKNIIELFREISSK